MEKNKLCHHHDECGNNSAYDLDTADGKTISVCEDCDESYGICEICKKCALDWEMSKYHPEDDYPTCNVCQERQEKELEAKLKNDVDSFIQNVMPTYHQSASDRFVADIISDVIETSGFMDEHRYNESDIALAFQRAIISMIEKIYAVHEGDNQNG